MKTTNVSVPWEKGLHARPATKLVHLARRYRSSILIKVHDRIADARSIVSILLLCATFGTVLEFEIHGDDEEVAISAVEKLFAADDIGEDPELGRGIYEIEDLES